MDVRRAVAAALLVALLPAAEVLAGGTPKPVPGRWKVVALFDMTTGGSFSVTKTMRVRGIRATPGSGASTGCGTAPMIVKGEFRLRKATRGGFTSWIVGRSAPATSDGVKTVAAKVTQDGVTKDAAVKLIFRYDNRRRASGTIVVDGCTLEFDARKG